MKKDILLIAGLFCIVLIIFFRVIFFNPEIDYTLKSFLPWHNNFPEASGIVATLDSTQYDLLTFNYPIWKTAVDQIKNLEMPLWNPYQMSGNSLLAAGQSNILDPFNLMVFLVSPETAYKLKIVIFSFLIALFTYIYARAINLSRSGSAVASIVFSFSGFCYEYQYFLPHTMAYAFFPLVLVFIHKSIFSASKIFYAVTAGLFLGIISLTAIIQYPIYYMAFAGIYVIFFNIYKNGGISISKSTVLNSLFIITIFTITGLSIGAMHLLPVAVLGSDSYRLTSNFGHYFPIIGFIQFLFPRLLSHPFSTPTSNNSFLSYIGAIFNKDFGLGNIDLNWYLGIFPLILTLIAIYRVRTSLSIFYTCSMVVIFLITFLVLRMPAMQSMNHIRLLHIFSFSAAILSGMGLDYLVKETEKLQELLKKILNYLKKIIIGISVTLITSILLLAIFNPYLTDMGHKYVRNAYSKRSPPFPVEYYYHEFDDLFRHLEMIFIEHLYLPLLLFLIYITLKVLLLPKKNLYIFKGLSLLIIAADLLFIGYSYNFPRKAMAINYPVTESLKFLINQPKPFRIYIDQSPVNVPDKRFKEVTHKVPTLIMPANLPTMYGLENVSGIESLYHKRYFHYWYAIEGKSVEDLGEKNIFNHRFLNLLNVKYILTNKIIRENNLKLVYDREIKIYENTYVIPRVFTVSNVRVVKEHNKVLSTLAENDFDPWREVVIEEDIPPAIREALVRNVGRGEGDSSKIEIIKYSPSRITIKTDTKGDRLLFLGDKWDKGWRVFIDSHESKIFRTNYIFRSVFLPEGNHNIEFSYSPVEVKTGFIISVSSLIACILYYIWHIYKVKERAW